MGGRLMLRRRSALSQACCSARPVGSAPRAGGSAPPQLGTSLLHSSNSAGSAGSGLLFAVDADSPRSALAGVEEEAPWRRQGRSPMLLGYLHG